MLKGGVNYQFSEQYQDDGTHSEPLLPSFESKQRGRAGLRLWRGTLSCQRLMIGTLNQERSKFQMISDMKWCY